ncbi:hypothetical protein LOK49_LG08G00619 [Camellia lanceoleosa]|uniref:Uncharacterized protein n=1 Tax=Camellia lanceoleosa TaxID=1840588 RepID=A0ACC0GQ50_9ERIC|nr:hypothetical protein LOK49_LG08G00619 [Camellia lanceoleosa]
MNAYEQHNEPKSSYFNLPALDVSIAFPQATRLPSFLLAVQHAHMTDTTSADYATVELIVNTLHRFFSYF